MYCPRCGALMEGGICNECGFPVTKIYIDRQLYSHEKRKNYRLIQIQK